MTLVNLLTHNSEQKILFLTIIYTIAVVWKNVRQVQLVYESIINDLSAVQLH